jgi:hypothetical protein
LAAVGSWVDHCGHCPSRLYLNRNTDPPDGDAARSGRADPRDPQRYLDANPHRHLYAHADANIYAHTCADGHANPDPANRHANADLDPGSVGYSDADANRDIHRDTSADRDAATHRDADDCAISDA